jgi:FtsP/CotA-like multicopper oxidase with cupredoxin domain
MKWFPFIFFFLNCSALFGLSDTLYIVKSNDVIGITNTYFCSFLETPNFSRTNAVLKLNSGDTLNITVVNLDTAAHTFTIDNVIEIGNIIPALDTVDFQILPLPNGTYRYYSDVAYGKYLGASGVLQVGYEQYKRYSWNLYDVDIGLSDSIALGQSTTVPGGYEPSYFLINGIYYPNTTTDSSTGITGNLNDTLIISVVNSGNMVNSFHFHGYHFTILDAKLNTMQIGWLKDSTPFLKGDAVTLMIVANQIGLYPIHSHNLVATTTGGIYPGGMISTINISP